jgi:hypothetical protein
MVPEEKMSSSADCRGKAAILASILLLACFLGACAATGTTPRTPAGQKEFFIPAVDEELFGTWVIDGPGLPGGAAKLKVYSWGLVEGFVETADIAPAWRGTSIIDFAWTDEQGNRWFREYRRGSGQGLYDGNAFVVDKVSANGRILESLFTRSGWPEVAGLDLSADPGCLRYRRRE